MVPCDRLPILSLERHSEALKDVFSPTPCTSIVEKSTILAARCGYLQLVRDTELSKEETRTS